MHDSADFKMKWRFNHAEIYSGVDWKCLSGLVPIQRSTVSFLGGLSFLRIVDPLKLTIGTACSLHWNDCSRISTVLYWMYCALLEGPKYRSWSMYSVMLANLLKHHAMWLCCSLYGVAHHSAIPSRVVMSGRVINHSLCRCFGSTHDIGVNLFGRVWIEHLIVKHLLLGY
jgi:hypothetical protein